MTSAEHRRGHPSPLIFHLGAACTCYVQGAMVAANATDPAFPWHPDLAPFEGPAPAPLEVLAEAGRRLSAMLDGIEAWQADAYRRQPETRLAIWSEGSTRLLDYGGTGPVVLVVPSLINRAYVLDLLPESSFLDGLAHRGLRPLLLDWGEPGVAEAAFDIDTYIDRRLRPALAIAQVLGAGPAAILGYCMGGTIAAGAVLAGANVSRLVTIGAPWDFAAGTGLAGQLRDGARSGGTEMARAVLRAAAQAFGVIPVPVFQQLFALVDPMQAARKFRRFAALEPGSPRARQFVALEDWLADGVAMAGPAAETLLIDWQLENTPGRGVWPAQAAGRGRQPAMIVAGARDSIAQPAVAEGLAARLEAPAWLTPDLGHVGMITAAAAPTAVWDPVAAFLRGAP